MNLFLLTSEYPPSFGGGIGTYCYHTARMMTQEGHHVTVFVAQSSRDDSKEVETDGNLRIIHVYPNQNPVGNCLGSDARLGFDLAEAVSQLIRKEGPPDLIESQEYLGLPYFLLQRKQVLEPEFRNIPIVLTLHSPLFVMDHYNQTGSFVLPHYWLGEMERFCIKAADSLISPSQYLIDELTRSGVLSDEKYRVLPNPFEIAGISLGTSSYQSSNSELLYLGRIERRKGIFNLLQKFSLLWEQGFSRPLSLIGGDVFDAFYQQWGKDWILTHYRRFVDQGLLKIEGSLPHEVLYPRLAQQPIVIVPSIFENYPYTVIETMLLGAIPLASIHGGQSEVIEDGKSGFTFSFHEPDSFETKLQIAVSLNDDQKSKVSVEAKRRVKEICSYSSVYPQKMEVYNQTISQNYSSRIFPVLRGVVNFPKKNDFDFQQKGMLSVVIPFYNAGAYLEDALHSVASVQYSDIEIILVDDGSTDPQSILKITELSKQYPIKVIHKQNGGLATARNTGAQVARGEFLTFLDADDTVHSEYYRKAIDILQFYENIAFVGCWAKYWGEGEGYWPAFNPEPPYLLVHNLMVSGALVYRTNSFLEYGQNDPEFQYGLEDYESLIHMVEQGYRGVVIPDALYNYRVRSSSMIHQVDNKKRMLIYNLIIEKHPEIYKNFGNEVAAIINTNGPGYLYENPTMFLPEIGFLVSQEPLFAVPVKSPEFPPAPASTYLYLAVRQLIYPLFRLLGWNDSPITRKIKNRLKLLITNQKTDTND